MFVEWEREAELPGGHGHQGRLDIFSLEPLLAGKFRNGPEGPEIANDISPGRRACDHVGISDRVACGAIQKGRRLQKGILLQLSRDGEFAGILFQKRREGLIARIGSEIKLVENDKFCTGIHQFLRGECINLARPGITFLHELQGPRRLNFLGFQRVECQRGLVQCEKKEIVRKVFLGGHPQPKVLKVVFQIRQTGRIAGIIRKQNQRRAHRHAGRMPSETQGATRETHGHRGDGA